MNSLETFVIIFAVLVTTATLPKLSQLFYSPVSNNKSSTLNTTKPVFLSILTENSRYWLSPSGTFAFGFYPIGAEDGTIQYIVGIWNHKSPKKTLVWVANRDDQPFSNPSFIVVDENGNLVCISDTDKILSVVCSVQEGERATYGRIHDNGNFVLYNSREQVIWESFDYPTDTILPGQILKSGYTLVASTSPSDHSSGRYKLRIEKDGDVIISDNNDLAVRSMYWRGRLTPQVNGMNLTSNGHVYLINWDDLIMKNFTIKGQHNEDDLKNGLVMYRAKLDSDGIFRLYRDEIDANIQKSWQLSTNEEDFYSLSMTVAFILILLLTTIITTSGAVEQARQMIPCLLGYNRKCKLLLPYKFIKEDHQLTKSKKQEAKNSTNSNLPTVKPPRPNVKA